MQQPRKTPRTAAKKAAPAPNPHLAAAEKVIAQTLAAGGRIDLGKVDFDTNRVLAAARSAANRPHDQLLRFDSYGGWYDHRYIAYLEDDLSLLVERSPVPVPGRVARPHPAVAAYKANEDRHLVTKDSLTRATWTPARARRRGCPARPQSQSQEVRTAVLGEFRKSLSDGHLDITVDKFTYGITIAEKAGKGGGRQDYSQRCTKKAPRWREVRQYNFVPTGQLSITIVVIGTNRDGRPVTFFRLGKVNLGRAARRRSVGSRGPGAGRCPVGVQGPSYRAREATPLGESDERGEGPPVASERPRSSTGRPTPGHKRRSAATYVAAMAAAVDAMPAGDDRDQAAAWMTWCSDHINADDPLRRKLAMPGTPEPTAQNLEPFLDGWSPYGPDGYGRH